jgi:hypothetical protein
MRALNNLAMVYRAKGLTRQAATLYEASLLMAQTLQNTTVVKGFSPGLKSSG